MHTPLKFVATLCAASLTLGQSPTSTQTSPQAAATPQPPPYANSTELFFGDFSFTPANGGNQVPFILSSNFTGQGEGSQYVETITEPDLDPTPRVLFVTTDATGADGTTPVALAPLHIGLWQLLFNESAAGQAYAAPIKSEMEGDSVYKFAIDANGVLFTPAAPEGLCVNPGPDALGRYLYNNTNYDTPRNPCVVQNLQAILAATAPPRRI